MYDDWVIAIDVEHADLEQRSVGCRANEDDQVIIEDYPSHGVANGMPDIRVGNAMLMCWRTDPHPDNIACLTEGQ